ncbi:hypothetical protein LCGC14_1039840, partial [marine sediment metagenome]
PAGNIVTQVATRRFPYFGMLRKLFYPLGKKRVSRELVSELDDFGLAVWFLDDGCVGKGESGRPWAEIECGVLPEEDVYWLCDLLISRSFDCHVARHNRKYLKIRFSRDGTIGLLKRIAKYIPPAMRYKLRQDSYDVDFDAFEPSWYAPEEPETFWDEAVVEEIPVPKMKGKYEKYNFMYCLDVSETHNFATRGGVVHNCFQSAADEWYPHEEINRLAKDCYPPSSYHLGADVWYPPVEGLCYLMFIDPGLGKTSESVATVWTFTEDEYKHCATFSGLYAGKEMADKCFPIARWYNEAVIANEDALDITAHLTSYPNLYYRTDPVTGMVGRDIGWLTTPATKVFMCNEFSRSLSKIITHDNRIVSQCRNIREGKSRGRMIPISVGADDYHDSAALAIVCRGSIQVERGFVGSHGWKSGWGE